eukprot:6046223-Amphidinium_carterae.1
MRFKGKCHKEEDAPEYVQSLRQACLGSAGTVNTPHSPLCSTVDNAIEKAWKELILFFRNPQNHTATSPN